jgi:pimeloyl-ACP methyl ester carboxylesterase
VRVGAYERVRGADGGGSPLAHDVLGAGHPFVLIHTDSLDRRFWDFQLGAFSSRFRVVRYDLRNHGRSPRFTGWYDGDRDLAGLLDTLSIGAAPSCDSGSRAGRTADLSSGAGRAQIE